MSVDHMADDRRVAARSLGVSVGDLAARPGGGECMVYRTAQADTVGRAPRRCWDAIDRRASAEGSAIVRIRAGYWKELENGGRWHG